MFEKIGGSANKSAKKKEPKPMASMEPLFSRLSIIGLSIGLVLGMLLGLGYRMISNSSSNISRDVNIQIVSPTTSLSSQDIASKGKYYVSEANTPDFFQFLVQQLAKQSPDRTYTTDELGQMFAIKYDDTQGLINLKVTAATDNETTFLIDNAPMIFLDYLNVQEDKRNQQALQDISAAIESLKAELIKADQDLSTLAAQTATDSNQNDPNYIALNAKINVLETELQQRSQELTTYFVAGESANYTQIQEQEYNQTLQQAKDVTASLAKAQQQLADLETKRNGIGQDANRVMLDAKITALGQQLNRLMTGYDTASGEAQVHVTGLVELIIQGDTKSATYNNTLKQVMSVSTTLAEAQKELAAMDNPISSDNASDEDLNYSLAKAQVDNLTTELATLTTQLTQLTPGNSEVQSEQRLQDVFEKTSVALADARKEMSALENQASVDKLTKQLDYQFAQRKVDSLNQQLTTLNDQYISLLGGGAGTLKPADYLAIGTPSDPVQASSTSLQRSLIYGAVIGVVVAWLVLNFRWLVGTVASSGKKDDES